MLPVVRMWMHVYLEGEEGGGVGDLLGFKLMEVINEDYNTPASRRAF